MKIVGGRAGTLADLLPPAVMGELLAAGRRKSYADGQIIQHRGDAHPALSVVMAGEVVAGNLGLDGALLVSALLRPGDIFGEFTLFAGLPRTHTLWAQGAVEIVQVSAPRFMALYDREPVLARALLVLTLKRNHEMLEFLDAQRRLSLAARLARIFLMEAGRDSGSEEVEVRHESLAVVLGVSRVAVGKAMKRLQKQGLVVQHYGRVELPDLAGLRALVASEDQRLPLKAGSSKGSPAPASVPR